MHLNNDFKEPLELGRLIQTVPEVVGAVKALIKLRYYLEKNSASKGFEAMLVGFIITSER